MTCPNCGWANSEGVLVCAACTVPLPTARGAGGDEPPPPPPPPPLEEERPAPAAPAAPAVEAPPVVQAPPPAPPPLYPPAPLPTPRAARGGRAPRRASGRIARLLVTVAVMAILAGILFPVFAKAREKARMASCLSNVKQINLGLEMYTMDYDDLLPLGWTWTAGITPYMRNDQVMLCPAVPVGARVDTRPLGGLGARGAYRGDYFVAGADPLDSPPCDYWLLGSIAGISVGRVRSPSQAFATFEAMRRRNGFGGESDAEYRHLEGASFGFVDGHAKWLPQGEAVSASWEPDAGLVASSGLGALSAEAMPYVGMGELEESPAWGKAPAAPDSGAADASAVAKLGLPVFPGAKADLVSVAGGVGVASLGSDAPFDEVVSWYERELGGGWDKVADSTGGYRAATFLSPDGTGTVVVTEQEPRAVAITLIKGLSQS